MPGSALIGNLAVNLSMETAAFQRGANIAEKRIGMMQKRMTKLGGNLAKAGTIMTAGITLPLAAFGKAAFKAASDAAELDAAFGETFGNLTKQMHDWSEATGNAMGRSTREIKEGANTFGLYFNQVAKSRVEAAKMSQTFSVLAQDLASFHNTDVETAIRSLRSGLSGEAEPMRKFGVFLSEAAVSAKAAEMGIASLGTKLNDEQKIMARYAIILEKTAQAQGDVARTSDSSANQIRAAKAAWEELQITVGTKLLPALTPLIEKLGQILNWFNTLSPATQTWVVGIGAAAVALGPLVTVTGGLIAATGALLPLLLKLGPAFVALRVAALALMANPAVLGFAAVVTGIYLAWQNWDKITGIVGRMVAGVTAHLEGKLKSTLDRVKKNIEDIKNAFARMYDAVVGNSYVPDMVEGIGRSLAELQRLMVDPALSATQKVEGAFQHLAGVIGQLFGHGAGSIVGAIGNLVTALAPLFGGGGLTGKAAFNATVAANPPGMARGGSGVFGGRSGIDKNILSLNGSPIARVSKGERFSVSPANNNSVVRIIPSPYFDVVVDGRAARVAGPMAGQAALAGAAGGMVGVYKRQGRQIP